jgi:hypothetical protein
VNAKIVLRVSACALVTALLAASVTRWPDDWDGLGFLASISRFDLDHFAPHPPGYPVYVAMLRAAAVIFAQPVDAANAVAVASGVVAIAAIAAACAEAPGARGHGADLAGLTAAVALVVTPLFWRAATGVGSEAPALAFAALGLAAVARARALAGDAPLGRRLLAAAVGASVGLGLGVRLSWAPLLLALLVLVPRGSRRLALAFAAATVSAWAAALGGIVGPRHLATLLLVHAEGHFHRWGGTAFARSGEGGGSRIALLARAVFVDGLGVDATPLGIAIAIPLVTLTAIGLAAWRRARWCGAPIAAVVVVPYGAWIFLGQNLAEQPRHALPVVVAAAIALSRASLAGARVGRAAGATLAALLAARTAADAHARRTTPPPGAAVVAFAERAAQEPACTPEDAPCIIVFGGRSARFFELPHTAAVAGETAATLGDVLLVVGRMRRAPRRVLVTSELSGLDHATYPLERLATLCRPPRLDRRAPCLDVFDWDVPRR